VQLPQAVVASRVVNSTSPWGSNDQWQAFCAAGAQTHQQKRVRALKHKLKAWRKQGGGAGAAKEAREGEADRLQTVQGRAPFQVGSRDEEAQALTGGERSVGEERRDALNCVEKAPVWARGVRPGDLRLQAQKRNKTCKRRL